MIAVDERPRPHSEKKRRETRHKLVLTLYMRSLNGDARRLIAQLTADTNLYDAGQWVLDVVEVLGMPEKALDKGVFATPMLVRDEPGPVLKLLVNLSRVPSIIAAITTETKGSSVQSIFV